MVERGLEQMSDQPDHYVLGIDDAEILEGEYSSYEAALMAADHAYMGAFSPRRRYLPWKVDIEARDASGDTLWVRTIWESE
jgi:hypothetical protein